MTVHIQLSSIGFQASEPDDFVAIADSVAPLADWTDTVHGTYLHWSGESGAEMWLQLNQDDKLIGMVPHFRGPSRMRVALTEMIVREDATELDAAFHAWAEPVPGDEHRAYPFVFDCPNPRVHGDLVCPTIATVQLAAFAHEIELFESIDSFHAAQAQRETKFALPSVIPAGLFSADGMSLRAAEAVVVMTGVVAETGLRRNEITGHTFHWCRLQSLAGEYDLVIDPALANIEPSVGSVATGLFWLSGRFIEYEKRRGFFDRTRGVG